VKDLLLAEPDTHDVVLVKDLGSKGYEVFPKTRQRVQDAQKCLLKVCFKVPCASISQFRMLGETKLGENWISTPFKPCTTKNCPPCSSKSRGSRGYFQEPPKLPAWLGFVMLQIANHARQ